jgi:hypothetical protein
MVNSSEAFYPDQAILSDQISNQDETPEAQARGRPRRPVSDAKRKANKANAQKSTCARTSAGRIASSLNAVTHGMTANTVFFLPGENQNLFYEIVNTWITRLGGVTEPECAEIERALYDLLKPERVRNATGAAGAQAIENLEPAYHDRIAGEVRELVPQLPEEPGRVVHLLRSMSIECSYLLNQ